MESQTQPPPYDLGEAVAALTQALAAASAPRVELLLHSAREWTGARAALLTVFAAGSPTVRASDPGDSGTPLESVLSDPALEVEARSGAIVRQRDGSGSAIAVPIYISGQIAGALEVQLDSGDDPGGIAVPALQILAGMIAAHPESALLGAAPESTATRPHAHTLHDPLTGLPGRALLYDRLHQAIQLARREEAPLAVLLIALTHLHDLSARLGPDSAQTILQEFAKRTRSTLRASDTVARADEGRLAVLLPGANAIGALGTVKKILRVVGVPFALGGQHVSLQAQAGIAIFPEHGEDGEALLERAGEALRQAEMAGLASRTYGE